jgi:predicted nuclease of predicted toxin-antitoxin system
MKILLDECVPVQVCKALPEHEVHSATDLSWRGLSNGELLKQAEQQGFNLVVVADKNVRYQQTCPGTT